MNLYTKSKLCILSEYLQQTFEDTNEPFKIQTIIWNLGLKFSTKFEYCIRIKALNFNMQLLKSTQRNDSPSKVNFAFKLKILEQTKILYGIEVFKCHNHESCS